MNLSGQSWPQWSDFCAVYHLEGANLKCRSERYFHLGNVSTAMEALMDVSPAVASPGVLHPDPRLQQRAARQ